MPKSFIEKLRALSEKQKLAIIITVVVIAGLGMGYFWVKDAMQSVSQIGQAVKSVDLPKIDIPDVGGVLNNAGQNQVAGWKTYVSDAGKFSLEYPSDWTLDESHINDDSIKSMIFSGNEGVVQVDYGQGFGGACSQGYEKIEIGGEEFDVCHYIQNDDSEQWDVSGKFRGELGLGFFATANTPHDKNRDTILKIFSTFKFTN